MRIAVLSDVHGNAHALRAVLADAERTGANEIWHLGDAVDRGGEPDVCVRLLDDAATVKLAGNHDLLVAGALSPLQQLMFNQVWLDHAARSRALLGADSLATLAALRPERVLLGGQVHVAHGSPRDPVWEYVDRHAIAHAVLAGTDARLVMVGHTHVARAFRLRADKGRVADTGVRVGRAMCLGEDRWVLNPGSVGDQPFKAPPHARWMLWDRAENTATWHRTEFDWHAARRVAAERAPLL